MKYIYYKAKKKDKAGLSDRRSSLSYILAESKINNRIAVIPKFILDSKHQKNIGKLENDIYSYILETYSEIDKNEFPYIFEEDFIKNIFHTVNNNDIEYVDSFKPFTSDKSIIIRNTPGDTYNRRAFCPYNLHNVADLANKIQGQTFELGILKIPLYKPTHYISNIGNVILSNLTKPILGIHIRRTDRLSMFKELEEHQNPSFIEKKISKLNYKSIYYCSDDPKYELNFLNAYNKNAFAELIKNIDDNYLLCCIEMYIICNCDIAIRTFYNSDIFYNIEKKNINYSLSGTSMHGKPQKYSNDLFSCSL